MCREMPRDLGSGSLITAPVAIRCQSFDYSGAAMPSLPAGKDERSIDPVGHLIPYSQAQSWDPRTCQIPDDRWSNGDPFPAIRGTHRAEHLAHDTSQVGLIFRFGFV
jgi:hypothetical protein